MPQDDIVHEDLTVLENIYLAKNLRGGFRDAQESHNVVHEVRTRSACTDVATVHGWPFSLTGKCGTVICSCCGALFSMMACCMWQACAGPGRSVPH